MRQAVERRINHLAHRLATTERHGASAYDAAEARALEWLMEREARMVVLERLAGELPPCDTQREMAHLIQRPYLAGR